VSHQLLALLIGLNETKENRATEKRLGVAFHAPLLGNEV
jgi:hypothetical protein